MSSIFYDLTEFFGINYVPETFAEFIPWIFQVVFAIAVFMFVFNMISAFVRAFGRGGHRW